MVGILTSALFSGELRILSSIPFTQLFYLDFLLKKYGRQHLPLILFSMSGLLLVMLGLKAQKLYLLFPKSLVVGIKYVITVFLVMQQFFQINPEVGSPMIYNFSNCFVIFFQNINSFPVALVLLFISLTVAFSFAQKAMKIVPFFFLTIVAACCYG